MQETIEQLKSVATTAISDVLKGMSNLDPAIKPLKENYQIAGEAFTVQLAVGDNLYLLKALKKVKPGDVLVVDVKGDTYRGIAGDFVVGMMQTLGVGGLVVDGAIRDVIDIKALGFPVFVRETTVSASSKNGPGEIGGPITCGGVAIQSGDIIVGDANGVVSIPRDEAATVLQKALAKEVADEEREKQYGQTKETIYAYIDGMVSKNNK